MNPNSATDFDPYATLGVSPGAGDAEIRTAYLARLKEFPPDRAPAEFERVRDAYDLLRDRRRRAQYTLFGIDPDAPLESLLQDLENQRPFAGPAPWLAVLKERKTNIDGNGY
ncbi:MAG TPA: J domain-containing protein [Terracidiphilus sp.]|nr:J domain-containing protein [Terracidiphilus sp.]